MTLTEDGRGRVLNNGVQMPLLGFGVWQIPNGRDTERAVRWALRRRTVSAGPIAPAPQPE